VLQVFKLIILYRIDPQKVRGKRAQLMNPRPDYLAPAWPDYPAPGILRISAKDHVVTVLEWGGLSGPRPDYPPPWFSSKTAKDLKRSPLWSRGGLSGPRAAGLSGPRAAGLSAPSELQRLVLGGAIKAPLLLPPPAARPNPEEHLQLSHQIAKISSTTHSNPLIFGGLKEKT